MPRSNIKVGIIGAGIIAHSHLKAIERMDGVIPVSIADTVLEKAGLLAEKYSMKAYSNYRQMLDNEQLDIVIINLPHYLHREAALECAHRGINTLLEKPMALNIRECDEIIRAFDEHNAKLMVGHIQRHMPVNVKMKEIIESNSLGKLLMIAGTRSTNYFTDDRPKWFLKNDTAGGGIIMNLGAHMFDAVRYLTGSNVKAVRAATGNYAPGVEVEGNGHIFAFLESGITASLTISGYNSPSKQEMELYFTGGTAKWVINNEGSFIYTAHNGQYEKIEPEKNDPFEKQLSEFISCISEDKNPCPGGEYGKSIIAAITAVYESALREEEVFLQEIAALNRAY